MAYNDTFRLSCHAVISNKENEILLLKANYGNCSWGLPGGAMDAGETIHQTLIRECAEELHCDINIQYLSGVYYHDSHQSQAFIFRVSLADNAVIKLSEEHSAFDFHPIESLTGVQKQRVIECLEYDGYVKSAAF